MKKFYSLIIGFLCSLPLSAQIGEIDMVMNNCPVGIFINGKQISPLRYSSSKVGKGAFLSGLTYGIAKTSNSLEYNGKTSINSVNVGDTISFIFGNVPYQYISTMYEFAPSYSPNSFGIGEFKVKKDKRELKTASISLWSGIDSGTKQSTDVVLAPIGSKVIAFENTNNYNVNEQLDEIRKNMPVEYQQYIPNVNLNSNQNSNEYIEYQFIVTEAKPGEYCFMFTEQALSGYRPVFDFSVKGQ